MPQLCTDPRTRWFRTLSWRSAALSIVAFLMMLIHVPAVQAGIETRTIPTRPGVTLDFLLMQPENGTGQRDALIMFAGGNGAVPFRLTEDGSVYGWNFLVRSADEFTRHGLSIVAVSPPSDHSTGMNVEFRESKEHADDIASLAAYLEERGFDRIFLVGNSRGTISAASLAARLKNDHLKGVILTSTLEYDGFMSGTQLAQVRAPVLMVHHREDTCRISPLPEALKIRESLKHVTAVDFVEVDGGAFYARSAPCDNLSAHGFFGVEDKVVRVIADWVSGRKVPERVE